MAALAIAGCGDDPKPRDERGGARPPAPPAASAPSGDVKQIEAVLAATASNREPCDHLTDRYLMGLVLEGIGPQDPREACEAAAAGQPEVDDGDVTVSDVRVRGEAATASFTVPGSDPQAALLVKQGGEWLIDDYPF